MTFFDWLASPGGVQLEHAVVILLLSAAAWFAKMARDQSRDNARLLNGHIEEHAMGIAHEDEAPPP